MAIAIPRTVLPIFYTPCIALLVFVLQLPLLAQEKSREDVEPAIDWLEDDPSNGSTLGTARDLEVNFAVEPVEESLQQNFSQQTDSTPTLSSDSTNDECSIPPSAFTAETPSPSISADSTIRAIRVEGSTVLPCEIQAILEQYLGRNLTAEQLSSLQDAITLVYIEAGYLTSRAGTPQAESDGTVLVPVIEGSAVVTVNRIENEEGQDDIDVACPSSTVTSRNRANTRREADFEAYIRRQLQSAEEVPLNTSRLEEELRFLSNDNTRFEKVESVLGSRSDGVSELVICYEEANPLSVSINFSNNAPPSVGSERVDVALSLGNVLEIGDQFFISNQFDPSNFSATRGINAFGLGYRLPLDRRSSTLQFRVEANRNSILQEEFRPLELRAASELYEVSFRYPLQRSYREELGLSVGFAYQDGQTFVFNNIPQPFGIGPDENGVSRTSVISLGIDYLNRDSTGRWLSQAQCRFGLGIFDATSNPGSIPDGQFVSCLGLVQRVQRIGSRNFLIVQADIQLSPDSLLPSQQFTLGGGSSVRGYRENIRSADNGFRFSVENRFTLRQDENFEPVLQLAPFVDVGAVWNHPDNPNILPEETFLGSIGLGILWQPFPALDLGLYYAEPFVDVGDRTNNLQDEGFHFRVNYRL